MMKKILLIGGTGAMGIYLTPELLKKGYKVDVVSLDDMTSENSNLTYLKMDCKDIKVRGHSEDSLAIFDTKTKTLISFDCLQQRGIDKYRSGISDKEKYFKSIALVRSMDAERIIFSHDYDPCGYRVTGKTEIENVLTVCEEYACCCSLDRAWS